MSFSTGCKEKLPANSLLEAVCGLVLISHINNRLKDVLKMALIKSNSEIAATAAVKSTANAIGEILGLRPRVK